MSFSADEVPRRNPNLPRRNPNLPRRNPNLPRRNPNLPVDTVFYSLYSDDPSPSTLLSLLPSIHSLLSPLLSTYIFHHQPFLLSLSPSPFPHLHGSTRFGENPEDEWFIVFLLFRISRAFPSTSLRVWDSDGEFLLIESAYSLPRWLTPISAPNRVFIRSGDLHIVPRNIPPDLAPALQALRDPAIDTRASNSIQSVIQKKISGYPDKARENLHRVTVTVPLPVARVLELEPCFISLSVESFYDRDVDSMKDAMKMERFLVRDVDSMVRVSVGMTRAMYVQLVQQRFQAPRCYPMPGMKEGPVAYKEAEIGMKIACGFEMMYQERKRGGEEGKGSAWDAFLGSLEKSGCFDGLLEGSKEYKRVMDNAVECYKSSVLFSRTRDIMTAPVKRIDEILASEYSVNDFKDVHLPPSDDDSWLYNGEDELNSSLLERQMEIEAYESKHGKAKMSVGRANGSNSEANDFNLKDVAESVQAFVRKISSFDGAEVPHDWSSQVEVDPEKFMKEMESVLGPAVPDGNSSDADLEEFGSSSDMDFEDSEEDDIIEGAGNDDTEDAFMQSYSDALNEELSSTTLKKSFIRAPRPSNKENEGGASASEKHIDEDLTPVDVDMNLVQSFLDSFASQNGLPGPASNLLGVMGLKLPSDENNS